MSPLPLVSLARRKAALTRNCGPDDPRTLAAAAELRIARLLADIAELHDDEREQLLAGLVIPGTTQ
jgi:hypothetical protein